MPELSYHMWQGAAPQYYLHLIQLEIYAFQAACVNYYAPKFPLKKNMYTSMVLRMLSE